MQIYSLADVVLTGGADRLSATPLQCKWFQVLGVVIADTARLGGADVSLTRGAPISAGGGNFSPPIAEALNLYDLYNQRVIGTAGDTVSVIYAV